MKTSLHVLLAAFFLLLGQSLSAAVPEKPAILVHQDGPQITVRWYSENVLNYRLYYASYPAADSVDFMDMGMATELSVVMPENSAYYLAVQAFNADGASEFSDVEYFVLDEYALMDKGSINPAELPLRLDSIKLNQPITFLPTPEDRTEQEQALRTVRSKTDAYERSRLLTTPAFRDGKIGLKMEIAPGAVERDLELAFCLEVGNQCKTLLAWDDDLRGYEEIYKVSAVKSDGPKNVYVDILMPPALVEQLRVLVQTPLEFTLRTTVVNSPNPDNLALFTVGVPVVDAGGTARQTRADAQPGYIQILGFDFGNEKFGVAIDFGLQLLLYALSASTFKVTPDGTAGTISSTTSRYAGIKAGPQANVNLTVFGYELVDFLAVGIKFIKNTSGQVLVLQPELILVGYDLGAAADTIVKLKNVASAFKPLMPDKMQKALDDLAKFPLGPYCRLKSKNPPPAGANQKPRNSSFSLKGNLTTEEAKFCSLPPVTVPDNSVDVLSAGDQGTTETADSDLLNLAFYGGLQYSQYFILWVIPVKVVAGAGGLLGLKGGGSVDTTEDVIVDIGAGPYVQFDAFASAAITIIIAEAGVTANLTLLEEHLRLVMRMRLTGGFKIGGALKLITTGPQGNVDFYAQSYIPVIGVPPFNQFKWTKTLIEFKSFAREDTLTDWGGYQETCQRVSTSNLDAFTDNQLIVKPDSGGYSQVCTPDWSAWDTSEGAYNPDQTVGAVPAGDAQVSGDAIPVTSDTEPAADEEGWVCLYEHSNLQGNKLCLQVSADAEELTIPDVTIYNTTDDSATTEIEPTIDYNDMFSSMKIWKNTAVGVYADTDMDGRSHYWYSLKGITINNFTDYNMNDKISSLMLVSLADHVKPAPTTKQVCFYKNVGGTAPTCVNNKANPMAYSTEASFIDDATALGTGWNDTLSKIGVIGTGVVVCLYADRDYQGDYSCVMGTPQGSTLALNNLASQDMDNKTSSYKIFWNTVLALGDNFAGSDRKDGNGRRFFGATSYGKGSIVESSASSATPTTYKVSSSNYDEIGDNASVGMMVGPLTVSFEDNDNGDRTFHLPVGAWDNVYFNTELNDDVKQVTIHCHTPDCPGLTGDDG